MISVQGLTIEFKNEKLFDNISFKINDGCKVIIKGESGAGKTTLLKTLLGFIHPNSGKIEINGNELTRETVRGIRSQIAWVPQELNFPVNFVKELVMLPFSYKRNRVHIPDDDKINEMFDKFGLKENIIQKSIMDISGGEKQRVILAISSLLNRKIIFLDEPSSALDKESKRKVMDHFMENPTLTLIAATHDDEWINRSQKIIEIDSV